MDILDEYYSQAQSLIETYLLGATVEKLLSQPPIRFGVSKLQQANVLGNPNIIPQIPDTDAFVKSFYYFDELVVSAGLLNGTPRVLMQSPINSEFFDLVSGQSLFFRGILIESILHEVQSSIAGSYSVSGKGIIIKAKGFES